MSHPHPITTEQVVQHLGNMSVMHLCELTRELETRWGVAAVPVPVPTSTDAPVARSAANEQTEFTVVLTDAGEKKIESIKIVRVVLGLGLKEAKDLVESVTGGPKNIKESVSRADADSLKAQFEAVGAKVQIQ